MNTREAAEIIDVELDDDMLGEARREAFVRAKQALEILATIEEKLDNRTLIIENFGREKVEGCAPPGWRVVLIRGPLNDYEILDRGEHRGEDLVDALGQMTTVLALSEDGSERR